MNKAILAPAGGRKTQHIVEACGASGGKRRLVLTFTRTGQEVIRSRLQAHCRADCYPEVLGWYSFLIQHIIKPYLPDLYAGARVAGLHFVEGQDPSTYRSGVNRYLDDECRVYSSRVGKLAVDVLQASSGAVIDRLERLYDEIYIDEVQDLTGNDLDLVEALLGSSIDITLVGDVRQSIYSTSRSDQKNKQYNGLDKVVWFRSLRDRGVCELVEVTETWRCRQEIVDLADRVLPARLAFPSTASHESTETGHDGVFVVSSKDAIAYISQWKPDVYRHSSQTRVSEGVDVPVMTFGSVKGITVERVLIFPTEPIRQFLRNDTPLTDESASKLYVAITRARHSVTFVVDSVLGYAQSAWAPDQS